MAPSDDRLGAVLWVQTSAEYRALALATFARARLELDRALADRTSTAALEQQEGTEDEHRRQVEGPGSDQRAVSEKLADRPDGEEHQAGSQAGRQPGGAPARSIGAHLTLPQPARSSRRPALGAQTVLKRYQPGAIGST